MVRRYRAAVLEGWGADVAALDRLHDAHAIVVDSGSIRMAIPFSAVATDHVVRDDEGTQWWGNCAWDARAIPVVVGCDATIESVWSDTGDPVEMAVSDGDLEAPPGVVHWAVPAARWWDDIVFT